MNNKKTCSLNMSQGNMTSSNYILNIVDLNNTVISASGISPTEQLQYDINNIQQMVNFAEKRIYTNIISKYNTTPIQITDDINLSNANLYQNGTVFTSGSGTTNTANTTTISSGGTAIILTSTISALSNAISFQVGGSNIFSFDGIGRATYFNSNTPSGYFLISSATLITDTIQIGNVNKISSGMVLKADSSTSNSWGYLSSLVASNTSLSISSSCIFIRNNNVDVGRIDSNGNWFIGRISDTANNDLSTSNDIAVISGGLRYQGGGVPNKGAYLMTGDSIGSVVLCNVGGGPSQFIVGDQIQDGTTSVRTSSNGYIALTTGSSEIARFTNNGFLGLSNPSPQATLDVNGNSIFRNSIQIQPGTGGPGYILTETNNTGLCSWEQLAGLSYVNGSFTNTWQVYDTSIKGFVGGSEVVRISTGSSVFNGNLTVNSGGLITNSITSADSLLNIFIGNNKVTTYLSNGYVGIGTSNPLYKLHVAGGTQSNEGALYVSTNLYVIGLINGNGLNITNIQTTNVGTGSNNLDTFQTTTRSDILTLQVGLSTLSTTVFSTINTVYLTAGLSVYSTLSSYIATTSNTLSSYILPVNGLGLYSTTMDYTINSQFSTLSSYTVINKLNISTLSSVIFTTNIRNILYTNTTASTTAFSTTTVLLSTSYGLGYIMNGNLGIGSGATNNSAYLLDIVGKIRCYGVDVMNGINPTIYTPSLGVNIPSGRNLRGTVDISGSLYTSSITVNNTGIFGGNVKARSYTTTSDRRYKKDVVSIRDSNSTTTPLSLICELNGVRFKWKDTDKPDIGLIAQDVLNVIPGVIEGDEEQGYQVGYDKLIPYLIESIKELNYTNQILASRVKILEERQYSL